MYFLGMYLGVSRVLVLDMYWIMIHLSFIDGYFQ